MQPGEWQLRLRLHTTDADHPHPGPIRPRGHIRTPRGVIQQRRLADTRIPPNDQHTAAPRTRARQQVINDGLLNGPPVQHSDHLPS